MNVFNAAPFNIFNTAPFYGSQQIMQQPSAPQNAEPSANTYQDAPRCFTYNYSSPNFHMYRDPFIFPEDDRSFYGCSPEQFPSPQGYEETPSNQSSPANIPSNEISFSKWTIGYEGTPSTTSSPLSKKDEDEEEERRRDVEKRNSTLWKMINDVNDIDELAINVTGTRPIPNLNAEDVEEFERSDLSNAEMPTDNLVINLQKEDATIYRNL